MSIYAWNEIKGCTDVCISQGDIGDLVVLQYFVVVVVVPYNGEIVALVLLACFAE